MKYMMYWNGICIKSYKKDTCGTNMDMLTSNPFVLALIVSLCDVDTKFTLRQVCRSLRNIEIKLAGQEIVNQLNELKEEIKGAGRKISEEKKTMILGAFNGSKKIVKSVMYKIKKDRLTEKKQNSLKYIGMFIACASGHAEIADLLIANGVNSVCYDYALDGACLRGDVKLVKFMMKKCNGDYDVALRHACSETCYGLQMKRCTHKEQLEIVKLIISYGTSRGCFDSYHFRDAIIEACEGDNIDLIDFLVVKGKKKLSVDDWNRILEAVCDEEKHELCIRDEQYDGIIPATGRYVKKIAIKNGATECRWCYKAIQDHVLD
jgi:hypothetical protein